MSILIDEEPGWLEKIVWGDLRVWQIIFLCLAGVTFVIVMVCCCFRFRIPRTKQQIEADYQRRIITSKFRQKLETIQDVKLDAMSLDDGESTEVDAHCRLLEIVLCMLLALELLHEKKKQMEGDKEKSHPSSTSPRQASLEGTFPESGQRPEPQVAGQGFVKFATKVANLSKLAQPKPTAPDDTNKMDF